MSVVIIGGNERMAGQYEALCQEYGYKAKVLTKEKGPMKKKIGIPDLLILFTNTVSHKMAISALSEAKKNEVPIARIRSSSVSALGQTLQNLQMGIS